ncbi:class I SAM-dependent methyltransferase [Actinokineospora globicatena]|uniref:Methyltransferase type 11 n=1 Tax=Actinokineospora globicatena TaxID=103729 RepID=A0A9W6QG95_9PSEU|nr:methyltransferase domain-containing protein [Actinokineospora globicatena]GLW89888.1 methyltransferase type 11 [Actinokineospora globicatena]
MTHPADQATAPDLPDPALVASIYDDLAAGHALHPGYWPDGYHADVTGTPWRDAADGLTDLFIDKAGLRAGAHLLDLGCGNGQPADRAARAAGVRVTGITVNPRHLATAAARRTDGLRFELVDGTRLPHPDRSFDAAWALQSLVEITDQAAAVREVLRVLRPGGRFVVGDIVTRDRLPQRYEAMWTGTAAHTPETLAALVREAGFDVLDVTDLSARTRCVVSWHVDHLLRLVDDLDPVAAEERRTRHLADVAVRYGTAAADLIAALAAYRHHPDYAADEARMGFVVVTARKADAQ